MTMSSSCILSSYSLPSSSVLYLLIILTRASIQSLWSTYVILLRLQTLFDLDSIIGTQYFLKRDFGGSGKIDKYNAMNTYRKK
jgi:hypothetical protein